MSFTHIHKIPVPNCSLEDLLAMVNGLADDCPHNCDVDEHGKPFIGDAGWSTGINADVLRAIAEPDIVLRGDFRGKTLTCAEIAFNLSNWNGALKYFAEHGYLPSAQGYLSAILQMSCRETASLPFPKGDGTNVVWAVSFSPGAFTMETLDSRTFHVLNVETELIAGRDQVFSMLGFKLDE